MVIKELKYLLIYNLYSTPTQIIYILKFKIYLLKKLLFCLLFINKALIIIINNYLTSYWT